MPKYRLTIGARPTEIFDSFEAATQAAKGALTPGERATIERAPYANDPSSGATFYFAHEVKQWILSS